MARTTVKINIKPLQRFAREVGSLRSGPGRRMLRQWGVRYLGFVRRRFVRFGRGGGNWRKLADSTIRRRRSGSGRSAAGSPAILRDTGTLLGALNPGGLGNLLKDIPRGIRVGFSGAARHPGGSASIADIAGFHNVGGRGGNPPQRAILVEPDGKTVRGMITDARRAMTAIARKHSLRRA